MRCVHYLQHWLGGSGAHLQVTAFVPVLHPLRQWADTFPWAALVSAIEQRFDTRFPKQSPRGRRPVAVRVLLALALLKHALGASDEDICHRLRTDFAVMYACGLHEYPVNPSQAHCVLPETLCELRGRIDAALMDALIAIQAAAAMEDGLVRPTHLVIDTFPSAQGSQRVTDATTLSKAQKKALALLAHIAKQSNRRTTQLHRQAQDLKHALTKVMRSFGRRCRGQGRVFVTRVRQTEQQLLALGEPMKALGLKPQARLEHTLTLCEAQRQRLTLALTTAMSQHDHSQQQSPRLTHGKRLSHGKLVHAYDATIAPIIKGKSNCPAQFGRKPGIASEPATGFIFATLVPPGNPSDPSSVLPLLDKVQRAIEHIRTGPKRQVHSVAGDLGLNDSALRQALHARGILTVGIAKTIEPLEVHPSAQEVLDILNEAGFNRKRTPSQVHLACASGHSRPVVESHIASLLSRGAGHVRYQGLEGAGLQQGMAVLSHNGAVIVRVRRQQVSKRAQKFRRLLGLKSSQANKINGPKN